MNEVAEKKSGTFTGSKLDWMTALCADSRLEPRAFKVGFCIAQHVNQSTGVAVLSDDTIGDKTNIPRRWIIRARNSLRDCRWIDWKRTGSANRYWTLGDPLNNVTDQQTILRDKRQRARRAAKIKHYDVPPMAHLISRDVPSLAQPDVPSVAYQDVPPVANIHLRDYTSEVTPLQDGLSVREPSLRALPARREKSVASSLWDRTGNPSGPTGDGADALEERIAQLPWGDNGPADGWPDMRCDEYEANACAVPSPCPWHAGRLHVPPRYRHRPPQNIAPPVLEAAE